MADPNDNFMRLRLEQLRREVEANVTEKLLKDGGGGGGSHIPPMNDDRIGKIEGQIEGIKHSHNVGLVSLGGGLALVATILIALGAYSLTRLDQINDKVNDLPGKLGTELRDITKTLAESITAAKQAPTQVIMVPTPLPPPTPQPRPQQ